MRRRGSMAAARGGAAGSVFARPLEWPLGRIAAAVLAAGLAAGCPPARDERRPVHPVRGRVTFLGRPLSGALVIFQPVESAADPKSKGTGQAATARTDSTGAFKLTSYEPDDGAVAGDYWVGVVNDPPSRIEQGLLSSIPKTKTKPSNDPLRDAYADPKTSGLKAHVDPGDNELPCFDLKEPAARRGPGPSQRSNTRR